MALQQPRLARVLLLLALVPLASIAGNGDPLPPTAPFPSSADMRVSRLDGVAPDSSLDGGGDFLRLEIGDRRRYSGTRTERIVYRIGEPRTKQESWTREATLVHSDRLDGLDYLREDESFANYPAGIGTARWLRQDRAGLFQIGRPPHPVDFLAMPIGREDRNLLTKVLAYPIHVGAKWTSDPTSYFTARVERRETIRTPAGRFPAWRIRLSIAGHPSGEQVLVWYGRAGYLGARVHTVTGSPGSEVVVTEDVSEWLETIERADAPPRRDVVAEAKEALMAVLAAEQVHFQKPQFGTYTDVADVADARLRLGIDLDEPGVRWIFSVSDASFDGFVGRAHGRVGTAAEGILVSVRHVRSRPPLWTVDDSHRHRNSGR